MRYLLALIFVFCAFSRGRDDGSALIQSVVDTASSTKTWRIDGSIEDSHYVHPATFTLFMRAPAEVRFQEVGSPIPAVIVCDTENAWVYSPPLNRYRTQPVSESTLCSQIVGNWKSLASTLKSPVLAGGRTVEIGGRQTECELVRGKSEATPPLSGDIKHELCIDKNTNLIVSEKDEYKGSSRTYTYRTIERDIDMAPDVFVLKLPPGSEPTPYHLPLPERLGSLSMPREPGTEMPRIVSKQDPVYDEASRRTGIQGTVVLYVVIDSDGVPSETDVFRHLTPGLDASAIEAVRHWRFAPATKNNQPIALGSMIEVNFKLR
jgi:TonB family protein